MSKLSVLDADPLFAYQYISSLTSLSSDIEYQIGLIQRNLFFILSSAFKASDESVLDTVRLMQFYLSDIYFQLEEFDRRLFHLSSLYSPADIEL
ncbi:hypothetical protein [Xylella fastidiosa]|uniref:hypothetical protein n=1 Tax=Xylella fastidiosa TaxID=2371 RepID=UPI0002ECD067|nr:hypothetical protein [Xylella fastidiosa]UIX80464.1 hypothetical protein LZ756_08045 [Xylella fastidiosa subsp. sandyi]